MVESEKEIFYKINMLEQYMQNVQQQIEVVEKEIVELSSLKENIQRLKGSSGKETFSSIGKNIFIKTSVISEELLVGIGGKNLIKKSIPEVRSMIKSQMSKLDVVKKELMNEMNLLNQEAEKMLLSMEKKVT